MFIRRGWSEGAMFEAKIEMEWSIKVESLQGLTDTQVREAVDSQVAELKEKMIEAIKLKRDEENG